MKRLFAVVVVLLLVLRLPSLVQPAGGDQGIYAYIGQSILRGEVPYRDAWDQKPPGVHFTYAVLFGLWNNEAVVPAADLAASIVVALLLVAIGRRLTGDANAGRAAAIVFLLLGDPSFQRLGGLWVRAQAETFIAAVVCGALLTAIKAAEVGCERGEEAQAWAWSGLTGLLLGAAFIYKYNAAVYALPVVGVYLAAIPQGQRRDPRNTGPRVLLRQLPALIGGGLLPIALTAAWFAAHGAFADLYDATITYNLRYSGETYAGAWSVVSFLATLPVRHARIDALWFVGGVGCALTLLGALKDRRHLIPPIWVVAACLSIAINGRRELPQYFVQAAPALALAAGIGSALVVRTLGPISRFALLAVLVVCVARVNQFDKWVETIRYDADQVRGAATRADYLKKFGGQRITDKFQALPTAALGDRLSRTTAPTDTVLVFGFSQGALVRANRRSATRFFWSRPLLVGFNEGRPGFGAAGLLTELTTRRPAEVVLQQHDWPAEGIDSVTWFERQPALHAWLAASYRLVSDTGTYFIWRRTDLP